MPTSEAQKKASKKYYEKNKNKGCSEALIRAQKKYRMKNKEKYGEYTRKARLKYYYNNKNYKDIDNMAKSFELLFS